MLLVFDKDISSLTLGAPVNHQHWSLLVLGVSIEVVCSSSNEEEREVPPTKKLHLSMPDLLRKQLKHGKRIYLAGIGCQL